MKSTASMASIEIAGLGQKGPRMTTACATGRWPHQLFTGYLVAAQLPTGVVAIGAPGAEVPSSPRTAG
jgi:hypothetical protein